MLLAIDVGNTNITIGVFDKEKLITTFRMTTKMQRTSDEYGITIIDLLEHNEISHNEIKDAIISSVVPNVMHSLCSGMIKYFEIQPMVVEPGVKTGIRITSENPAQIGADRIVDAVGAYELYGGPVVVIDYGTATTYDFVNGNGDFFLLHIFILLFLIYAFFISGKCGFSCLSYKHLSLCISIHIHKSRGQILPLKTPVFLLPRYPRLIRPGR